MKPSQAADHPRIRGEHCTPLSGINNAQGSSPHTRGARHHQSRRLGSWIIPAYAGSTPCQSLRRSSAADHPRIRGEHVPVGVQGAGEPGSSPHTRGARAPGTPVRRSRQDHPRIRGEHELYPHEGGRKEGSSPHTRGALRAAWPASPPPRIIPAYAGSTPTAPSPR